MDAAFAMEVLEKAPYVTVSFTRPDGTPYGLPLSLARTDERTFYFHCALEGEKLDCIAHCPTVFLSAVTKCAPTVGPKDGSFTLQYKSATAVGRAELITGREEKVEALRVICQRFLPKHMDAFNASIARSPSAHRSLVTAAPAIIWVSGSASASSSLLAARAWGKAFRNAATFLLSGS